MRKQINNRWYFAFFALTITLVSLISWDNIIFKAIISFVGGLLGLIRVMLLKFGLITTVGKTVIPKNQLYTDLFISFVLFVCSFIWFKDPHSSIGHAILIIGLITKIYLDHKQEN